MVGQTLGHYKVLELLGKGGMGEVYRAEDITLGREVAVKALPQEFTENPERLARFEREAKLLATLNHPHIAQIHALEEVDGQRLLVMELVEGETLAERLSRGSLPVEDALPIALQITQALEAAHERGIVHRDLKPANVKVTPGRQVKVLDFGLAKPITDAASGDLTHSPTLTYPPTGAGVLLGTASYMSPEQARGQEVDRRTDIWSFGVVLWEMLTGRQLFDGNTVSDLVAGVLKEEPPWQELPPDLPRPIQRLLHRCLTRDPKKRLHDIADARLEIEEAISMPSTMASESTALPLQSLWQRVGTVWWALLLAFLLGAGILGLAWWSRSPGLSLEATASSGVHRAAITVPDDIRIESFPNYFPTLAASPDSKWLVFVAKKDGTQQLFKRPFDQEEVLPIPGSENAGNPFVSTDGRWVAFFDLVEGKLKKVDLEGGSPIALADTPNPWGGTWGRDGTIVLNRNVFDGLWRVAESGGPAEPLLLPDPEEGTMDYYYPSFLPDGKAVLFTAWVGGFTQTSDDVGILDLESGETSILLEDAVAARYLPSGHLLYARGDHVEVAPFDLETRTVKGPGVPIPDPVTVHPCWNQPDLAVTQDGTVAFLPGSRRLSQQLVEVDLGGNTSPIVEGRQPFSRARYSPDGNTVAVSTIEAGWSSISVINPKTGVETRLVGDGNRMFPVWSPDGERIAFSMETSDPPASWSIFSQRVRGADSPELLLKAREPGESLWPYGWTPDGSDLVFGRNINTPWRAEIWRLSLNTDGDIKPLVNDSIENSQAALSPDGEWLAYVALEPGRPALYVQRFPESGERHRISRGSVARIIDWSPDGQRIYYVQTIAPDVAMEWRETAVEVLEVEVTTSPAFEAGVPRRLFQGSFAVAPWSMVPPEDLSPDGRSLLMITPDEEWRYPGEIRVVFNWFQELERLAPTSGN